MHLETHCPAEVSSNSYQKPESTIQDNSQSDSGSETTRQLGWSRLEQKFVEQYVSWSRVEDLAAFVKVFQYFE